MRAKIEDQPAPTQQPDKRPVWESVIGDVEALRESETFQANIEVMRDVLDDMVARDAIGRERYGTPLTTHNGRDHLVDAYQEALDKSVYLRADIMENGPAEAVYMIYKRTLEDIINLRAIINERSR